MSVPNPRDEIAIYVENAREMLEVAARNVADGFYGSAINRAYYAIFYVTNALLRSEDIVRSKHSSVIAAFRQHFVKPGLVEVTYSDIYGRVMEDRRVSDYDIATPIEPDRAQTDLEDARRFVDRIELHLREGGWL